MSTNVPLFATREALEPLLPEIAERMRAVLDSGSYVLGKEVAGFEAEFAAELGVGHSVGVNSGTDALAIGLRALGVKPGDEVVVPAVSFFATAEAVVNVGARPVFADVEPLSWNLTASTVEAVLSERTTALVPVHLFGAPAAMGDLMRLAQDRGLAVLEDAAQAAGSWLDGRRVGSHGDAAAFSFYPSKALGAMGDAGALVTNDAAVAARARRLREHGSEDRTIHTEVGYNARLDELQAAALRVQLPRLDGWAESRRAAAEAYAEEGLPEVAAPQTTIDGAKSGLYLYIVATPERDRLQAGLEEAGIGNRVYFTPTLERQPALAEFAPPAPLPGASRYAAECLALPIGPSLRREEIARVAAVAREALA
jgi:dTDP-4-amino-4,6-dideoxygalactose transaminase